MIARKLIAAVLFSALSASAAFGQAMTNAPPKATTIVQTPAASAPAATGTTAAKPATAKPAAAPVVVQKPAVLAPTAAATGGAKVNLNTASAEELDKLPQIGPARAKAIVAARATARFKDWNDFVARKVVPANALAAIQNRAAF